MVFKSEAQLKAFLLPKIKAAVADVELEVYKVIDSALKQYYAEFEPEEYIRTNQLLHSLVKTRVVKVGNGYQAEVYFDAGMLNYITGPVPLKSGRTGWATWGAEEVLNTAMNGSHGGYIDGTAIWGTSLAILGDIKGKLVQALKAQGIPIG